ncbi:MAG: S1/P1 nuclease [Candidatus Obscuribacterales bacterium]|nr:S1/P1 nuclease [Candidatus Obscuribacterales bacterium]
MLFKFFRLTAAVCAAAILVAVSEPAHAWNDVGHMTVAGIAYKRLDTATKAHCDALIKLNPYYENWLSSVPTSANTEEKNMIVFMLAATWPDVIKGDKSFSIDGANGGYKPEGAVSARNIGYEDHLLHKYWHFIDYPFSTDGSALPVVPSPNAETEISEFTKVLNSGKSDAIKSYDLTWLVHIVGDIHQPLHCVTRVSKGHPDGDNGGNMVKIRTVDGDSNLHAYWDNMLGMDNSPYRVMRLVKKLSPPMNKNSRRRVEVSSNQQLEKIHAWIQESAQYARQDVYVSPIGQGNGPFFVDRRYKKKSVALARKQVVKAGVRLADLLNNSLY